MNMLDMYTRETANKAHIAELHREARTRHRLRELKPIRNPAIAEARIRLVLVVLGLVVLIGTFLLAVTASL
jgi:hypothetical protein